MTQKTVVGLKEQLRHIVIGTIVFVFLGTVAVMLDLLDIILFVGCIILLVVYIATSSWQLIKELAK